LSTARDRFEQLQQSAFLPYLESRAGFEKLPTTHGDENPIRQFYNASQNLLSAMSRDLAAVGVDPSMDVAYGSVAAQKEQALKLIYFPTLMANVEFHRGTRIDSLRRTLFDDGYLVNIPRVSTMTRADVARVATELSALGVPRDWQKHHKADIAVVRAELYRLGQGPWKLDVTEASAAQEAESTKHVLLWVANNSEMATPLRAAANRLLSSLQTPASATELLKTMTELRDLAPTLPGDWVTTERHI
jgi:hypothetical protein